MIEKQYVVDLALIHGTTNHTGRHSAIEIQDPHSHALIRIELDMETLGSLLHGGRDHKVRATFRDTQYWGKKIIRKSIKVFLKKPLVYAKKEEFVRTLAVKYEVNGWIFAGPQGSWSRDDHGHDGKREYVRLHFKKYVKVKNNVNPSK